MQRETRILFNEFRHDLARLNGVADVGEKFNVTPRVQQTMESRIMEQSDFLKRINMHGVKEQMGNKIGVGVSGTIASTTDTDTKDREPFNPATLDEDGYVCSQTNFDTSIKYKTLDLWAGFPDFQVRIRNAILRQQALDRIIIGFNGIKRAPTSDRKTNPMLQDVNTGWLEKIRKSAPSHYLFEVASGSKKVKIGKTVTGAEGYKRLDGVVFDVTNSMIEPWYREDTDLVVVVGRALMADKYFPIMNSADPNTEQLAGNIIISQKRIGNLPAVQVPFFPANAIMICRLDLLSIYWQLSARRRAIIDNPKRDRIENYESTNDAYVVEDYGGVALIENITLVDDDGKPRDPVPDIPGTEPVEAAPASAETGH
ncbi:phage major capsid protein, P2 family [Salmonella enterica subsp. enterica]|uniref:Phage major capsid protein, P2 family n=1 Tax=Salmonella enterica I TaxID=59201 RepID=A0A5U3EP45_SALET|nr:phage major capsid protein, P2 family [Salmonella enterica subsp. enterica]